MARGLPHYGHPDFSLFIGGAYPRGAGLSAHDLARPIIGIAQTYREFNPCPRHFREVAEAVQRGVGDGPRRPGAAWGGTRNRGRYSAEDWLAIYAEHLEIHANQIDANVAAWRARPRGTTSGASAGR